MTDPARSLPAAFSSSTTPSARPSKAASWSDPRDNRPSPCVRQSVLANVRAFSAFDEDNDPHGEHDFGVIDVENVKCFWKIDYYDADGEMLSPDPADPAVTKRVLTVMLADE